MPLRKTSRPRRSRGMSPGPSLHGPQRTCVQCGTKADKKAFRRIAGRPGEAWEPDPGGGRPGRGLYLCRSGDCIGGFARRIRTQKGAARFRLGAHAARLADRLEADRGAASADGSRASGGAGNDLSRGRRSRSGSKT